MLFVVTHVHTPELCPSGDPKAVERTVGVVASDDHAKKTGVRVLGRYIAPPEHTLFFVIESDNYGKVVDFFTPLMKMGTPRITPVYALGKAIEKFGK